MEELDAIQKISLFGLSTIALGVGSNILKYVVTRTVYTLKPDLPFHEKPEDTPIGMFFFGEAGAYKGYFDAMKSKSRKKELAIQNENMNINEILGEYYKNTLYRI